MTDDSSSVSHAVEREHAKHHVVNHSKGQYAFQTAFGLVSTNSVAGITVLALVFLFVFSCFLGSGFVVRSLLITVSNSLFSNCGSSGIMHVSNVVARCAPKMSSSQAASSMLRL